MTIVTSSLVSYITGSDWVADEQAWWGYSVDITDDVALIGAPNQDGVNGYGAVYVITASGGAWDVHQRLEQEPTRIVASDFGYNVSLNKSKTKIAISAHHYNTGSVFIFTSSAGFTYGQEAELTSSGDVDQNFGESVAIRENTVVVGSPFDDEVASNAGAIYVFHSASSGWNQVQKLTSSAVSPANDNLGHCISIYGDTCAAGASATNTGEAHVFVSKSVGWVETDQLGPDTSKASGTPAANLMCSQPGTIDIDGDYIICGAIGEDESFGNDGGAYIFERGSGTDIWSTSRTRITAPTAEKNLNANFGWGVSISGSFAVVGADGDLVGAESGNYGSGYMFYLSTGGTWTYGTTIHPGTDGKIGIGIGVYPISTTSGTMFLGAYTDKDDVTFFNGSTRLYEFSITAEPPTPCSFPLIGNDFTLNHYKCLPNQHEDLSSELLRHVPFSFGNRGQIYRKLTTPNSSSLG